MSQQSFTMVVDTLTAAARGKGLNDSQWAAAASVRKETLSRLRRRATCDFATLWALAAAVDASFAVWPANEASSANEVALANEAALANEEANAANKAPTFHSASEDGHFPARLDRAYEERLLDLCAGGASAIGAWRAAGPAFFMAGLAVMLASVSYFDRRACLQLAERLHPGSSQPDVFALWLQRSPLRPSRFLPLLDERVRRAA